ncbi:MAG: peptidoglycan-associated lipoprotein Pal [Nitrospinae bacterium]|nr:peptidoglycan-associated lipoprotein Pal [Nitrospinota bacterium]MDA1110439.1 peptidoglycan-associated lipoprotein Pal [Nitrospinota bacterium]
MMKTSKQILLITLILFIFFASGCSKNFFGRDDARPDSNIFGMAGDLEEIEEKSGGVDSSSGRDDKTGLDQKVGAAEQGVPGNGASGSFSAEPFAGEGEGLRIDGSDTKETPEPFLTEKGEDMVASLPHDEQARRSLPYHPIDHLTDIHFAFDKYDLDDKSRAILQENVAYLKTHPASRIEIRGHCDERGSNSYNISLGERRAQSTKSYLTSLGVDASRIRTISYGEERPFCFESNEACWYQNRRAHFLVAD